MPQIKFMNKSEFIYVCESITSAKNLTIDDSDYEIIETVYAFHPAIPEVRSKEQIAWLYTTFGMTVINDMLPRAIKARELENKISQAKAAYDSAMQEYNELKAGH